MRSKHFKLSIQNNDTAEDFNFLTLLNIEATTENFQTGLAQLPDFSASRTVSMSHFYLDSVIVQLKYPICVKGGTDYEKISILFLASLALCQWCV